MMRKSFNILVIFNFIKYFINLIKQKVKIIFLIFNYILIYIFLNINCIFSSEVDQNIINYLEVTDVLLQTAINNAKRLYLDNGGQVLTNENILISELVNIPIITTNQINPEQLIKKVQIAPDFRIKIEFNQTKTFGILKNAKLIFIPEYNKGDIYITKYQCYTNFDIFYPVKYSGQSQYGIHNTSSILNRIIENQNFKAVKNCIYLDQNSSSWKQINW